MMYVAVLRIFLYKIDCLVSTGKRIRARFGACVLHERTLNVKIFRCASLVLGVVLLVVFSG